MCIYIHAPSSSFGGNGPTSVLIHDLVPVLNMHGVHAYFSGHDHNLQHLQRASVDGPGSTHYFVCGGGGYDIHDELKPGVDGSLNAGVTSLFKATQFGFAVVQISEAKLRVEFISGVTGNPIYQAEIEQH
jgi:tartrate-resistant acid phosphatase type 5